MQNKKFKLDKSEIRSLAEGYGACFATDRITVEGYPVRFMYRDEPDNDVDSGWRFLSGVGETEEYMEDSDNIAIYDVNTIANYDPSIIPHLDAPIGCCFEKLPGDDRFTLVDDSFDSPDDES